MQLTKTKAEKAVVVAVDGTAGSGKSSICSTACKKKKWVYLNTGAIYRAVAYLVIQQGVDPQHESKVCAIIDDIVPSLHWDYATETIFFKKGSNLYNLDLVRKLSNKVEYVYLVEGYMDVVSLSSKGIENVVANLGTSLTDRQVLVLNQFYDDLIICFDGDESGYKAGLRAAENLIKELKPEKQISFLFLPDGDDPDSFVNKNGKEYFIEFTNKNKIPIHNFIFEHYKNQTKNDPSSLAIFEKTIRSIANSIKDEFIKKYE